jgi:hypothetical protein
MERLFTKGIQGIGDGSIDLDTDDIRVALCPSSYTYDDTDMYVADLGVTLNGRSANLANKSFTDGVFDADDITTGLTATANVACNALILYKYNADDAAARLIAYKDGRFRFKVAAAASSGGTAVTVDPLSDAIASGAVATRISGTGPATITLGAAASADGRSLTVSALGDNVAADAIYEVDISGNPFPFSPGAGQNVPVTWSSGSGRILRLG